MEGVRGFHLSGSGWLQDRRDGPRVQALALHAFGPDIAPSTTYGPLSISRVISEYSTRNSF